MNMEGAGSLRLANWLYNAAPKDGTVFGTTSRAAPFASLIGTQGGTSFDPTQFNWIGSANNEVSTCVSWHTAAGEDIRSACAARSSSSAATGRARTASSSRA